MANETEPCDEVTCSDAINLGLHHLMSQHPSSVCYGLGVSDPGRVFGTTRGLVEEFGVDRVFEGPTSELAMTGFGVGLAISGHLVVHSHQRMDFALLAMDQLVNSAAKWRYMFGDRLTVPYLARFILGRGWGQGPTHSQNFESWLAQIPGIRVIVPTTPEEFFTSLLEISHSIHPIALIEHRWLHSVRAPLDITKAKEKRLEPFKVHLPKASPEVVMVTWGLATYSCLAAQSALEDQGIGATIIQIVELNEDWTSGFVEIPQTVKSAVVIQNSLPTASYGEHVLRKLLESDLMQQIENASLLSYPDTPEPSSLRLIGGYHISENRILEHLAKVTGAKLRFEEDIPVDKPADFDFGPF